MAMHKKTWKGEVSYPFCRQPWHLGAVLLGFGFIFTVVWAFHLLNDIDERLAFLRFARSGAPGMSGMMDTLGGGDMAPPADMLSQAQDTSALPVAWTGGGTATMPPVAPLTMEARVRAALVNIAGMRQMAGGTQPKFVTAGSGVLVTASGYVVTAAHVTAGLKEIWVRVQTPSGPRQYTAQVVKSLTVHNLAVLKLVSRDLFPFVLLAPEAHVLKPGDSVVAWGDPDGTNALVNRGTILQANVSVMVGGSEMSNLVRTDAVSHWSQGGGPLVDRLGRVVGINVVAQSAMGIVGYAVPSDVLLAHFQDVVTFPKPSLAVNRGGGAAPMAPFSPAMVPAAWRAPPTPGGSAALDQRAVVGSAGMAHMAQADAAFGGPPNGLPNAQAAQGGPGAQGMGGQAQGARETRPADTWWAKAMAEFGILSPGGEPQPLFGGKAVHVAATAVVPAAPVFADGRTMQPMMVPVVHSVEQRYWGYSFSTLLGLLGLGLISGISGGMMTMGGGIIKVTGLLLFFGYGMLLIRPVAYITNIFLYGAAVARYRRYDLIRWDAVRGLIPWAMIGVGVGYFIGNVVGTLFIHYLLGVFAALVGVRMLVEILTGRTKRKPVMELDAGQGDDKPTPAMLRYLGIGSSAGLERSFEGKKEKVHESVLGLPMGIVSGILGITGGVVEVPLQRYVVGLPLRNAIANSAVLVFFASSVGSIVAMVHGIQSGAFDWSAPLKLAVILIPGAYVGGWIGAWLTKVVPIGALRWLYAVLMFVIAGRMFLS